MVVVDPAPPARHRGLTLIEVLVALGLVLALAALVLPLTTWMSRLGGLESTRDDIEAILLQARATARFDGRPVEVRLEGDRLLARWFDPAAEIDTLTFEFPEGVEPPPLEEATWAAEPDVLPEPWARRRLAPGIEATDLETHRAALENENIDPSFPAEDPLTPDEAAPSHRLAVMLPDGGALVAPPLVFSDGEGAAFMLEVDPWTARPRLGPVPVEVELEPLPEASATGPDPIVGDDDPAPGMEPS